MVASHRTRYGEARLQALSISRRVWPQLQGKTLCARVLGVFERACSLLTDDGDILALVLPKIGDGPLNMVVDGAPGDFAMIELGVPARLAEDCMQIGEVSVCVANASVWEPRPDWDHLRACHEAITQQLTHLLSTAIRYAPAGSLLALLSDPLMPDSGRPYSSSGSAKGIREPGASEPLREAWPDAMLESALAGAEALRKGWAGDVAELRTGATQLAGLGVGLTPAGDDFLTGVMLWAWLAQPAPRELCRAILEASSARTSALSAAFLRVAVEGECSAAWHRLLDALASGNRGQVVSAVGNTVSHGHTSGADALAGFLWMAMAPLSAQG